MLRGIVAALAVLVVLTGQPALAETQAERLDRLEEQIRRQQEQLQRQQELLEAYQREIEALRKGEPSEAPLPGPEMPVPEAEEDRLEAVYDEGLRLRTSDGSTDVRLGGELQTDLRLFEANHPGDSSFFGQTDLDGHNQLFIRRARLYTTGTLLDHYDFEVEVELADDDGVELRDAWLDVHYLDEIRLRVGQFKEPFSLEELSPNYEAIERSLAVQNLAPARDVGAMLHGDVFEGTIGWAVGLFNGNGIEVEDRPNLADDGELATRLTLTPFATFDDSMLQKLSGGISFTYGRPDRVLAQQAFLNAAGTSFLSYNFGVFHDDIQVRVGADLSFALGPIGLKAEHIYLGLKNLERGTAKSSFDVTGGYVQATCLLAGERAWPWIEAEPIMDALGLPFYGGLEAVARIGWLHADHDILSKGFAIGTNDVRALTLGLNWYLNRHVRLQANYVRSFFDDSIAIGGTGGFAGTLRPGAKLRDNEDVFLMRLELRF